MTIMTAVIAVGISGYSYYVTPLQVRPFRSDYQVMKPSGRYSQGLGVIGATMITVGVTMYSTRKRARALRNIGKLSRWLEIHMFLCLLGPILAVYHTTFKAGGIAGIALWTMLSVAVSGIVGRFLYVQIPRNLKGAELTDAQINGELQQLGSLLGSSPLGVQLVDEVDQAFRSLPAPVSLLHTAGTYVRLYAIRRHVNRVVQKIIAASPESKDSAHSLYRAAAARASLLQKRVALGQASRLFYYWHVIHVPFTIIMFITLVAHVTVTILLGYKWIF